MVIIQDQEWRQTEIDYLQKFWGRVTLDEMVRMLGRSHCDIRKKALEVGLISEKKPEIPDKKPIKKERRVPPHLREELKHFICDVIESKPNLRKIMRARLEGMILDD